MKEGEIKFTLKKTDKGNINILRSPHLLQVIMRQKHKTAPINYNLWSVDLR